MLKIPRRLQRLLPSHRPIKRKYRRRRKVVQRPAHVPIHLTKYEKKCLLWLILFAPVGVCMMWRKRCGWMKEVKYLITGFIVLLAAAIILIPMPNREIQETGIRIVEADGENAKFGPPLPVAMVSGFVDDSVTSSLATDEDASDVHYVYAADGAECYHEYECKFAFASAQRLTVYEAHFLGFRPCGRCKPNIFDGTLNGRPNDGTDTTTGTK